MCGRILIAVNVTISVHIRIATRLCVVCNELAGFNSLQFSVTLIFFPPFLCICYNAEIFFTIDILKVFNVLSFPLSIINYSKKKIYLSFLNKNLRPYN